MGAALSLTDSSRSRQGVTGEDGVHDPVLLGATDRPSSDDPADRLRLTLDWVRGAHDTTLSKYELLARIATHHQRGLPPGGHRGKLLVVLAELINAELRSQGILNQSVSATTVGTALKAAALPEEVKQKIRAGVMSASTAVGRQGEYVPVSAKRTVKHQTGRRQARTEELSELARIRAIDAGAQYRSMMNAPMGKLNLPLIRRAEKVMEMLTELIALDPAKAVSQLPAERCREFTVAHAAWWSEFARLCEERRVAETPDLLPRPFRPTSAALNPVVLGSVAIPTEERGLTPAERAVLDWTRAQDRPVTAVEVAVGLKNPSKESIALRLRKLAASGLVEVVGKVGNNSAYQAVEQKGVDEPRLPESPTSAMGDES